jgi:tetratricopeptide (TPR) repeat protein
MRKIYKFQYLLALAAGALFSACNDFLDVVPDNRTTLDSPEAISELLVSAYPSGNCIFFAESMSDNVTDRGNTLDPYVQPDWNRANQQAFFWQDIDMTYQDSPNYFWMASYEAIAAANHALEAIEKLEAEGTDCSVQKGEALVCRAYNHFMLVNVFAQHYHPTTAATDLGVPYVTEPEKEVFGHYERISVKETYEKIRKDLEEGLPLISNKAYGETPKYHFTYEAAQAFACRFYLYIGEWEKAINAANEALGDSPSLRNWNTYSAMTSANREKNYTSVQESANILLSSTVSLFARDQSFYRYGFSSAVKSELFGNTKNLAKQAWAYRTETYTVSSEAITMMKWKAYPKSDGVNSNSAVYYLMVPLFTNDEVVCDRIEALAMANRYDEACKDIELFLSNKIKDYNASLNPITRTSVEDFYKNFAPLHPFYESEMSAAQMAFVNCAVDLRRREQVMEGGRWFDIKRFDIEVTHKAYQTGAEDVLVRRDLRRAVQIPEEVISYGIEANPR